MNVHTIISTDTLLIYNKKNYLQVYLDNCAYEIVNKQLTDHLDYKCMYHNRIDLSEGIDPHKSYNSKECMICHYWLFNNRFKFQDFVCNGCHDLPMLCLNISNIAIITVKNVGYCFAIHSISKF